MNRQDTTAKVLHLRTRLYKGMYVRVARKLGVSLSIVRRVGLGKAASERIEAALVTEMRRIERRIERTVGQEEDAA